MKTAKNGKYPVIVSEGGVSAKIRKITQTRNGTEYVTYLVDYVLLGKRKQVGRTDFEDAKQVALNACRQIASGNHASSTLTDYDRMTYVRAMETLPSGAKLDTAMLEYALAIKHLPAGVTLQDTVDFYRRLRPSSIEKRTVRQIADEMLAAKRTAKLSAAHVHDLQVRLNRFCESFEINFCDVTGIMIEKWLDGMKISGRSKQNYLRVVTTLFRFAIRRKYLPKESFGEIEAVQPPRPENKEVGIFTPDEMREILAAANPKMVPWLAIGAFAGLRSAEIDRLDWSEVNLTERHIEIKASKAKTAARRLVPITDNLAQWLTPYAKQSGKVIGFRRWWKQIAAITKVLNFKRTPETKFAWKHNALRHSFCSYRLAAIKNAAHVALEAGNSPQMIFRHYRQLVTESDAAKWFSIVPETPPNIISLAESQKVAA
ncbi:MAG TPA: site-specific integrase [Candidatus Sulfotelmatobacter sp.]|nr:site-specific integrase [Candidatus Sulfotelmatobacter sp.]